VRDSHLPEPELDMTASRRARSSLSLAVLAFLAAAPAHAQGIESPRVPVRTAIKEINTLRAEYADLYNKKDAKALTAMYLPDAVMIRGDGSTLLGQDAIGKDSSGEASVSHYLVVLRRGVEKWQVSSVAVVPVTQVTTTK
jgi:hypothetical protein